LRGGAGSACRRNGRAESGRARAGGWVTGSVAERDPTGEPVGAERRVAATTDRLALGGRIDRIDQRGDELVVVDYKTGRSPSTEDDARGSPALATYVLGVRRTLRRPCRRVELHHLPSRTVAVFEHTDRSLANHVRRAEDVLARGAEHGDLFAAVLSLRQQLPATG